MVGAFDEERYNKYMLDSSGPKRRDILSAPVDETDAVMQDLSSFYDDGAYAVKGGEKFAIGSSSGYSSKREKTPEELEQEELARALEQIRKLEEEQMFTGTSETEPKQISELLKQGEYVYELYSIMIHTILHTSRVSKTESGITSTIRKSLRSPTLTNFLRPSAATAQVGPTLRTCSCTAKLRGKKNLISLVMS